MKTFLLRPAVLIMSLALLGCTHKEPKPSAGGKGSLGRPIMKSEIEQPTPYNTYVVDGLPPGPIANPGRASLEAAANPARTKELYFVADGTGGHVFSENYAEHQKNVARLRGIEHGPINTAPATGSPGGNRQ